MARKTAKQIVRRNKKRKDWVNKQFKKKVKGKSISNRQKTKLLKKLWRQAKRKYK